MTTRERFHKLMSFEKPDRMPILEWATWWDKTVERWKADGLKITPVAGLTEWQALKIQLGLDLDLQYWINFRTAATPKPAHHGAPLILNEADYDRMLPTLYPADPFDHSILDEYARRQADGALVWLTEEGYFWGPRTLLGIENHLYAFYDQPELMRRINNDIAEFNARCYEIICRYLTPDFMTFCEDLSYNKGPMLSEAAFDEFMLPYYNLTVPAMKARGTRVFIDSDGDITRPLSWFERAGIEGALPLERQAGVDVARLRDEHPNFLFIGHYDKMVMPLGVEAMRAEFERLLPTIKRGGFIAAVDHQTPPGVSMENYLIYLRLQNEYSSRAFA